MYVVRLGGLELICRHWLNLVWQIKRWVLHAKVFSWKLVGKSSPVPVKNWGQWRQEKIYSPVRRCSRGKIIKCRGPIFAFFFQQLISAERRILLWKERVLSVKRTCTVYKLELARSASSMHVMVAEVSQFGTFVPNWIELKRKQKL
jgi:hypothetical protein